MQRAPAQRSFAAIGRHQAKLCAPTHPPAPTRPARPTISPGRNVRFTSRMPPVRCQSPAAQHDFAWGDQRFGKPADKSRPPSGESSSARPAWAMDRVSRAAVAQYGDRGPRAPPAPPDVRAIKDADALLAPFAHHAMQISASLPESAAVGSSMMSACAWLPSARAISTNVLRHAERAASVSGSISAPTRASKSTAWRRCAAQSTRPKMWFLFSRARWFPRREFAKPARLLVDSGDASALVSRGEDAPPAGHARAICPHRLHRARDDLDQGGLARAVLAHQRVHLADAEFEADAT